MSYNEKAVIQGVLVTLTRLQKDRGKSKEKKSRISSLWKKDADNEEHNADYYIGELNIEFAIDLLDKFAREAAGQSIKHQPSPVRTATVNLNYMTSGSGKRKAYNYEEDEDNTKQNSFANPGYTLGNLENEKQTEDEPPTKNTSINGFDEMKREVKSLQNRVSELEVGQRELRDICAKLINFVNGFQQRNGDAQTRTYTDTSMKKNSSQQSTEKKAELDLEEENLVHLYQQNGLAGRKDSTLLGLDNEEVSSRAKVYDPDLTAMMQTKAYLVSVKQGDDSYIAIPKNHSGQYYIFPVPGKQFNNKTVWERAYGYFFELKNADRICAAHRAFRVIRPAIVEQDADGKYQLMRQGTIEVMQ